MENTSPLLGQEGKVERAQIFKTQAPLMLGQTHLVPSNSMDLIFKLLLTPPKLVLSLSIGAERLWNLKTTHREYRDC